MSTNKCNILDTHNNKNLANGNSQVSNYALKVALHTMKERCQKLQNRLSCLEEENLQLRIEQHSIPGIVKKERELSVDNVSLHKKIEELNRQKCQLSHHIFMVATENKELWERLSKLSDEKNLEIHSKNFLATSSKHNVAPDKSLQILELCKDAKDESLEEISLKVLNSIRKARSSLEGSECDEAMEWRTNGLNVKECEFDIKRVEGQSEVDGIIHIEMKDILDKLNVEKTMLKQQQEELKNALDLMFRISKEKKSNSCKTCVLRTNEEAASSKTSLRASDTQESEISVCVEKDKSELEMKFCTGFTLKNKDNAFEDRICPLCSKFYAKSTPFDEFNDHVLSHFVEDPEQDSHMSLFEITA